MARGHNILPLILSILVPVLASACGNTEWNVSVHRAIVFNDSINGVDTECKYTVADTARVNEAILRIKPEVGQFTFGWTIPRADGTLWLVAYDSTPLLSEKVSVTDANAIVTNGEGIQVVFKFPDAKQWETITRENIGKRLAVIVNGQLMCAPQVNTEITSGNCAVSIPAARIHDYLPHLDLDELKRQ